MLGADPPDHVFAPYGAGAMTNVSVLMFIMIILIRYIKDIQI